MQQTKKFRNKTIYYKKQMDTKFIGKQEKFTVREKFETDGRIFMENSTISGRLAEQRRPVEGGKGFQHRKIVAVSEDDKLYAIPVKYVKPFNEFEEKMKGDLTDLKGQVTSLIEKGETEGKKVLDKTYLGFTGKQIAIGALILLLLLKIK